MIVFLAVFVTLLNVILWPVIIMRFKKIFSTDEIIERTRSEMEKMLRDMNNNAARNIDLLEDRIEKLHALMHEADRKIKAAENELNLRNTASDIRNQIENLQKNSIVTKGAAYRALESYKKSMGSQAEAVFAAVNPADDLLSINHYERRAQHARPQTEGAPTFQGASRSAEHFVYSMPLPKDVELSAAQHKQQITLSKEPVKREKSLAEKVTDFAKLGFDAEYIARELSCSKTEVDFILSLKRP